jgi:hypothetical protein
MLRLTYTNSLHLIRPSVPTLFPICLRSYCFPYPLHLQFASSVTTTSNMLHLQPSICSCIFPPALPNLLELVSLQTCLVHSIHHISLKHCQGCSVSQCLALEIEGVWCCHQLQDPIHLHSGGGRGCRPGFFFLLLCSYYTVCCCLVCVSHNCNCHPCQFVS